MEKKTRKDKHRDEKLDSFIGKDVTVTFTDGKERTGILIYVDEFSLKYNFRRPWHYHVGNTCFRKYHVNNIKENIKQLAG